LFLGKGLASAPLLSRGNEGHVPDLGTMLDEYYEARGWDPETGKPSKGKLLEMMLEDVAEDLWRT